MVYKNTNKADKSCDICNGKGFLPYFKNVINGCSILKCKNCGVWILDPIPSDEDREKLYQDDYYARWGYGADNLESIRGIKKKFYSAVLKDIETYIKPAKILDIGCAMGFSLEAASERGWQPYGIEISEFAAKIAKKVFGDNIKIGDIQNMDFENGGLMP